MARTNPVDAKPGGTASKPTICGGPARRRADADDAGAALPITIVSSSSISVSLNPFALGLWQSARCRLTDEAVRKHMLRLAKAGILTEIAGRQSFRAWALVGVLDVGRR